MLQPKLSRIKDDRYYSTIRWDIIDLIPEGRHKVLDVGCGAGSTLKKLKETGKALEIWGVEVNAMYAKELEKALNGFFMGDAETHGHHFENRYFDYIIFGDVLEHLYDPKKTVRRYKNYLKDDGFIIASVPNLKYFRILIDLILFDRFEYRDTGILDNTHLRFFTKKEIVKIFEDEGFRICRIYDKIGLPLLCNGVVRDMLPAVSFFTYQYLLKTRKASVDRVL